MRHIYLPVFSMLLLVGVGCASTTPAAPAPEPAALTSWPAYVMSSGDVMLRAPEGWNVRQFDSGGGSDVRVSDPASEETLAIWIALSQTEDGSVVSYGDWLAGRNIPESTSTIELGGLTLQSREIATDGGESQTVYTGVLNTQPARYVAVRFSALASAELLGIVKSIQFSPTQEEREGTKVIP